MNRGEDRALDIVGLGYCAYDILAITPGLPEFDSVGMTPLADLVHDGGGQVGTALTALARLGARTGYVGVLGDDREGRWLRDRFGQEGIDVARLRTRAEEVNGFLRNAIPGLNAPGRTTSRSS